MIRENHLVFQAKSFYNAYIALEQISRQSEDDLLLLIPTIVNGLFSDRIVWLHDTKSTRV